MNKDIMEKYSVNLNNGSKYIINNKAQINFFDWGITIVVVVSEKTQKISIPWSAIDTIIENVS